MLLAVGAQVIAAVVALADKYIVSSDAAMPRPLVYAFYTCLLSGVWIIVFLLGMLPISFLTTLGIPSLHSVVTPTLYVAALSVLAAYTFFIALVSLYTALKDADASDVVPVVGAISAVAAFCLSYVFLGTRLTPNFMVGIALLAFGTFLVSQLRFTMKIALLTLHAGLFFAVHFVTMKGLFDATTFDNGFFWSRVAFIAVALSMLLVPSYFTKIKNQTKATSATSGMLVFATKVLAGVGSILVLKATAEGDVSVVQALGGLQFVLLLLFAFVLGNRTPKECGENITCDKDIYHKAVYVGIITIGFFFLFT